MTLEMKDELELNLQYQNRIKENEISNIIKLFQFSNLNLLVSNFDGEIAFASNAFCNFSGFYVKELVKLTLNEIFNEKFSGLEILKMETPGECLSARKVLRTKDAKEIQINTYNWLLKEFPNPYIISIITSSHIM